MKPIIISYSFNGNNKKLASALSQHIQQENYPLSEIKPRNYGKIFFDILFMRTPKVENMPVLSFDNHVILVGPIWIGRPAIVLKKAMKSIKKNKQTYSFISISGGDAIHNKNLEKHLLRLTGSAPSYLGVKAIAALAPDGIKPQEVMQYQIDETIIQEVAVELASEWKKALGL